MSVDSHWSPKAPCRGAIRRRLCGVLLCCGPALAGCQSVRSAIQIDRDQAAQARTLRSGEQLDTAIHDYQSGDILEALDATRRARGTDPTLSAAYELEAMLHADLGNEAEYIAALNNLIAAHPETPQLQSTAGRMLVVAGERTAGLAAMQQAVRLAPRETAYARDLAGVYLEAGDLTTAAAVLTAAQLQNPDDHSLPLALARLYETAGDWQLAMEHYSRVVQHEPKNALWRRQTAKCLYRLQQFPRAAAEFQKCLEIDVAVLTTADRVEFGDACLRSGELERATWLFDQLAQQGHDTREVSVLRGVCALRNENPALAEKIFAEAVERWPNDPSLELLLNNSRQAQSIVMPVAGEMEWLPPVPVQ